MLLPELVWTMLPQITGLAIITVVVWQCYIRSDRGVISLNDGMKGIACDSTNCVRCRRYVNKMSGVLKDEWREYVAGLPRSMMEDLDRLSLTIESLKDVDSSDFKPTFEMVDLATKPFHIPSSFAADVLALESNYHDILLEYRRATTLNRGWLTNSTPTGQWKTFYLVNQGMRVRKM